MCEKSVNTKTIAKSDGTETSVVPLSTYTKAIRGAITLNANTKGEIKQATIELVSAILKENNTNIDDMVCAIFTLTADLNADFPAKYARLFCGFENVPMMCHTELDVPNALKKCLRVMILVNTSEKRFKHQYLKGAKILREDIENND